MEKKSLGWRIRKYRLESGFTAETFAERVELSTSMIREIERGTRMPSLGALVKIANSLGVSADELLCDSIDKSAHRFAGNEMSRLLNGLTAADISMIRTVVETIANEMKKRGGKG